MKKILLFFAMLTIVTMAMGQIKVTTAGSVGIGTNNPTQKLFVEGNAIVSGKLGIGCTPASSNSLQIWGTAWVDAYNVTDWGRAMATNVYTSLPCAYHLYNSVHSRDVFYVRGDGYTWAWKGNLTGSDIAFKKNITPIEDALRKVISLQGVRYQYIDEGEENSEDFRFGFIAQEVEPIIPEVVKEMHEGTKAILYTDLIALLVEAIKEQQNMIENLQKEIQEGVILRLEADFLDELRQKVEYLENVLIECCNTNPNKSKTPDENNNIQQFNLIDPTYNNIEEMKLYQNAPNPFNEHTMIQCYIPDNIKKVELCVYNMQGAQVKCLTVSERGNVKVQIQAGQLSAGIYTYLLIGDGKTSDAKQMILTK